MFANYELAAELFKKLNIEKKTTTPHLQLQMRGGCFGDPYEIRTRVTAVKGRCLRPLDQRAE